MINNSENISEEDKQDIAGTINEVFFQLSIPSVCADDNLHWPGRT